MCRGTARYRFVSSSRFDHFSHDRAVQGQWRVGVVLFQAVLDRWRKGEFTFEHHVDCSHSAENASIQFQVVLFAINTTMQVSRSYIRADSSAGTDNTRVSLTDFACRALVLTKSGAVVVLTQLLN